VFVRSARALIRLCLAAKNATSATSPQRMPQNRMLGRTEHDTLVKTRKISHQDEPRTFPDDRVSRLEDLFLRLPPRPRSRVLGFAITTAMVALSFAALLGMYQRGGMLGRFPMTKAGVIDVILRKEGALTLVVKGNGVGCPVTTREGMGSRLTRLLAQQLAAQITWESRDPGCQVRVVFPDS
jgi:hypothetical protein